MPYLRTKRNIYAFKSVFETLERNGEVLLPMILLQFLFLSALYKVANDCLDVINQ